jgi:hypothetical protein
LFPFDCICLQIWSFPIDNAHLVSGAIDIAFQYMLGVGGSKKRVNVLKVNKCDLDAIDSYLSTWAMPLELNREVRELQRISDMKMSEHFELLVYHSVALCALPLFRRLVQEKLAYAFTRFVVAMHLIGGHRHEEPSDADLQKAHQCLRYYVYIFWHTFGDGFMIYKNHLLLHLAKDAACWRSHLGSFDSYVFESFLRFIRENVKNGKEVLTQLHQRLQEYAFHQYDSDPFGKTRKYRLDPDTEKDAVKRLGHLNIPQNALEGVSLSKKKVKFLGFELRVT